MFRTDGLPVSFGQSLKCTLSVPLAGVPMEHALFVADQGRVLLRVCPNMTGRIATGGEMRELAGDVEVTRAMRGKLHVGDATILFQEMAAPAIAPRAQLPASVRGTLADRIDRRLATIVSVSLLAHLGIASWAWMTDREGADGSPEEAIAYDAPKYDVFEMTAAELPPDPTGPSEPGVAAPVAPKRQTPSDMPKTDVTRLPDPVDVDQWANALTGNVASRTGQTEIASRAPRTDLDKQVQHVKDTGANVKVGGTPTSRDRDPRLGTGPDGGFGDPSLDQIAKKEKPPVTRIEPVPMPKPPGKDPLPITLVLGRIQGSYMAGLQRCYVKHGLAQDSKMAARVALSFTVDERGGVTNHKAAGANAEVDRCILDQMAGWRFPIPKDADGDATDASFKLVLALQPS